MGADIVVTLVVMALCLIAEAFFSGSEIAIVSADRIKLRHQAAKGSRGAQLALNMLQTPEWLLSTTLVGTNIAVVTNTTMAAALMIELFGEEWSWLAVLFVAPLIWVFGEIVPKSVFQQRSDAITPKAIFVLKFCTYLFYPILIVFSFLARLLARTIGSRNDTNPFTLREEIITMMQMPPGASSDIAPMEQTMIRRLFNFGETRVRDVMMPLIDVIGVEQGASCEKALKIAVDSAHKTLPVYAERVDRVVGVVDSLDLLGMDPGAPIDPFVRPVNYVPPSKSIQNLLIGMRKSRAELAVVVDEFGGVEGIVTLEDIMEEVVEDIQDEYDGQERLTQWVRRLGENDYLVSARIDPDALREELGIELPEGNYATLAGFLLEKSKDVPGEGKVMEYQGMKFTVQRATPRVIQEVRVEW